MFDDDKIFPDDLLRDLMKATEQVLGVVGVRREVVCPDCGHRFLVKSGRGEVKCPECNYPFIVS